MKKQFIILFLFLFVPVFINAQENEKSEKNEFSGVWQLCELKNDTMFLHSVFKIFGEGGEFCNVRVNSSDNFTTLTAKGRYEKKSDSIFVEYLEQSTNSTLNGKTTELEYKILGGDEIMIISFYIEKDVLGMDNKERYTEIWRRVKFPF